jgi:hypothetical protein
MLVLVAAMLSAMQLQGVWYSGASFTSIPAVHRALHDAHHWFFSKQVKLESMQHVEDRQSCPVGVHERSVVLVVVEGTLKAIQLQEV